MAAIKDVAECAGLSVSVVSKYLKNADSVREDTRERIKAAIDKLGYVPSAAARSLRTGKTNMYEFLVPEMRNSFFASAFQALCMEGYKRGITVVMQENKKGSLKGNYANIQTLQSEDYSIPSIQPVDGIIVSIFSDADFPKKLAKKVAPTPVVLLGWPYEPNGGIPAVLQDFGEGFYQITKMMIHDGHTKIAYVGDHIPVDSPREKYSGYKRALEEAGIIPDSTIIGLSDTYGGLDNGLLKKIINVKERPTAIVAETDELAASCIRFLHANGIRVPEDMSVSGCDNVLFSKLYVPSITTLEFPLDEICSKTMDLLGEQIQRREENSSYSMVFLPKVIRRESTAARSQGRRKK